MNHLTLHAYEEDGELFVWRCPECGSTGPKGSDCPHEPPIADYGNEQVARRPVRVPGVGEEPRYTLEEFKDGMLDKEAVTTAVLKLPEISGEWWDRIDPAEQARIRDEFRVQFFAALDHFTQQQLHDLKFAPRSYTPEQAAVIKDAVANRKPLSTQPLPVQQSSGGQEAAEFFSDRRQDDKKSGGQEGGVEEGADRIEHHGHDLLPDAENPDDRNWYVLCVDRENAVYEMYFKGEQGNGSGVGEGAKRVFEGLAKRWRTKQEELAAVRDDDFKDRDEREQAEGARRALEQAEQELLAALSPVTTSTQPISDYKSGEGNG